MKIVIEDRHGHTHVFDPTEDRVMFRVEPDDENILEHIRVTLPESLPGLRNERVNVSGRVHMDTDEQDDT